MDCDHRRIDWGHGRVIPSWWGAAPITILHFQTGHMLLDWSIWVYYLLHKRNDLHNMTCVIRSMHPNIVARFYDVVFKPCKIRTPHTLELFWMFFFFFFFFRWRNFGVYGQLCANHPGNKICFVGWEGGPKRYLWGQHSYVKSTISTICPKRWNFDSPTNYPCVSPSRRLTNNYATFSVEGLGDRYKKKCFNMKCLR